MRAVSALVALSEKSPNTGVALWPRAKCSSAPKWQRENAVRCELFETTIVGFFSRFLYAWRGDDDFQSRQHALFQPSLPEADELHEIDNDFFDTEVGGDSRFDLLQGSQQRNHAAARKHGPDLGR